MYLKQPNHFRKQALGVAMTAAIGAAGFAGTAAADQITFSSTGIFTLLGPSGAFTPNSDKNQCTDPSCSRTAVTGTVTYDTATGAGSATIVPFSFFASGLAVASSISMAAIGDGAGGSGDLLLTNMGFTWNGNNGIPVSLVWDGSELFSAIAANVTVGQTITGSVLSASDNTKDGAATHPIGGVVLATTTWNTTDIGVIALGTNPSGTQPLKVDNKVDSSNSDIGIGSSPMKTAPFGGFNANFDFTALTVTSFKDTTPPDFTATPTVNVPINSGASLNSKTLPGLTLNCNDAHSNPTSITASPATIDANSNPVNTQITVTYTCKDSIKDDSTARNAATATTTVTITSAQAPTIVTNDPTTVDQECGVPYIDTLGATAKDFQDNVLPYTTDDSAVDVSTINTSPGYPVIYTTNDINGTATSNRTVIVDDTTDPDVTIPACLDYPTCNNINTVPGNLTVTLQSTDTAYPVPTSATATDACDTSVSSTPAPSGTLEFSVPPGLDSATNPLAYSVSDTTNNTGTSTLTIQVERAEPVISLVENSTIAIAAGALFTDPGVTVHDVQDGDATYDGVGNKISGTFAGSMIISSDAGSNLSGTRPAIGSYTITYDVTDSDTNAATQVTRTLVVGAAYTATGSNFSMIGSRGSFVDGASDILATWGQGTYDETTLPEMNPGAPEIPAANMNLASAKPTPFFDWTWNAHDVHVVSSGTYTFETCPPPITVTYDGLGKAAGIAADGSTHCVDITGAPLGNKTIMTVKVNSGQVGAHMLFDWGAPDTATPCGVANCNIDVFVVWEQNAPFAGSPADTSTNLCAKGKTWDYASVDPDNDGVPGVPMRDGAFVGFNANFNLRTTSPCGIDPPPDVVVQTSGSPSSLGGGSADLWTLSGLLAWLVAGLRRKLR